MQISNPQPPEHINNPPEKPLREFAQLLLIVGVSFVVLSFALIKLSYWWAPWLPIDWEPNLIGESTQVEHFTLSQSDRLDRLYQCLETVKPELSALNPKIYMVEMPAANAMATLGSNIMVSQILAEQLDDQALLFVIAHEIGHLYHRDPIKLAASTLSTALISSVLLGSDTSSVSISSLVQLSFNREQEHLADQFALDLTPQLGVNASHIKQTFAALTQSSVENNAPINSAANNIPEFFQTHPHSANRVKTLTQQWPQNATIDYQCQFEQRDAN